MDDFLLSNDSQSSSFTPAQSNKRQSIRSQQNQLKKVPQLPEQPLHKNKYINKLKDIIPESQLNSIISLSKSTTLNKKQKNKYSAKLARDRKKLYLQIMQNKKKNLEIQLSNKKKQLQQNQEYLEKIITQQHTMSNFTIDRHMLIKRLQKLLEQKNINESHVNQQINSIMDMLKVKIGATGKERVDTIQEYFRQIVNLSLPALHRYMMWSATQGRHIFSDNQQKQIEDQWFRQLKQSMNLSQHQKKQIQSKRHLFISKKQSLTDLINNLKNIKNDIQSKSVELESMIDGIRQVLTPIQCAYFILFIQKNKYRKELNLCDDEDITKKKIKIN